jgi:hypothetical protein
MSYPAGPGDPPKGQDGQQPTRPDTTVTDLGTLEWCWARLLTTTEGVLFSHGGLRPSRRAVRYSVDFGQVQIPIGSYPGTDVTLGLVGHAADGQRWVVRATGVAQLSTLGVDPSEACRSSHPSQLLVPDGADTLLLNVDRLRGYRGPRSGACDVW